MFDTLLIANRGEIACRIIRTARARGLRTVAVYSDADAQARHVRLADVAVRLGPAPARESYLDMDALLAAARRSGAQAIHPGYGFLAENDTFAQACADAGLVFIGPSPEAIRAMGSKSAAKGLMGAAGVPLTPGYHGTDMDAAHLQQQADAIGYPLLIKASAGGGGKGMRRVDASADFAEALASCQREAAASFGNDQVLLERYVLRPRHIEIQVFGDSHGNYVYLNERDCSVQRRHQKVLEEAPAPGMSAERRRAMGEAAVAAARAVDYVGAGTVEFIVAPDGEFYFMEMNTRLQVEHPVTEMITGQDLVDWQLQVAAGAPLPLSQDAIPLQGHAIEARIYAEDPARGFLPSTGRLHHLVFPGQNAHVRIDTGVEAGDTISPHYDPMIAKLIVHDTTRERALLRLRRALADCQIGGVQHNVGFLGRLATSTAFAQADLDTALIEREHDYLFPPVASPPAEAWQLAAALVQLLRTPADAAVAPDPWAAADGWRLNQAPAAQTVLLRHGDSQHTLHLQPRGEQAWDVRLDDIEHAVAVGWQAPGSAWGVVDGRRQQVGVDAHGEQLSLFIEGERWSFTVLDPWEQAGGGAQHAGGGGLTAPMPGKVIAWRVEPGAEVAAGAPLLVLEAMKMEHAVVAPSAGRVVRFLHALGEQVEDGAILVEFDSGENA